MSIVKATELAGAGSYPANRLNKRERKVLQTAEQYDPTTDANWSTVPTTVSGALDTLAASGASSQYGMATATVVYDFATSGGAVSSINLGVTLPDNAIITEVIRDEITAATSAGNGATIILNVPTDGNLEQTAITADGSTPTLASSGGSAVPKKLTAARELRVTIATEAVTAGKIRYHVRYYKGE